MGSRMRVKKIEKVEMEISEMYEQFTVGRGTSSQWGMEEWMDWFHWVDKNIVNERNVGRVVESLSYYGVVYYLGSV
jgi:hypothetical protein